MELLGPLIGFIIGDGAATGLGFALPFGDRTSLAASTMEDSIGAFGTEGIALRGAVILGVRGMVTYPS